MNYRPYVGYWFYGGSGGTELANFFSSWGLLSDAPEPSTSTVVRRALGWFWEFFN